MLADTLSLTGAQLSYSGGAAPADEGAAMVRGLQASGAAVDTQLASGAIRVFGSGRALTSGELAPNEAAESSGVRAWACRCWTAK